MSTATAEIDAVAVRENRSGVPYCVYRVVVTHEGSVTSLVVWRRDAQWTWLHEAILATGRAASWKLPERPAGKKGLKRDALLQHQAALTQYLQTLLLHPHLSGLPAVAAFLHHRHQDVSAYAEQGEGMPYLEGPMRVKASAKADWNERWVMLRDDGVHIYKTRRDNSDQHVGMEGQTLLAHQPGAVKGAVGHVLELRTSGVSVKKPPKSVFLAMQPIAGSAIIDADDDIRQWMSALAEGIQAAAAVLSASLVHTSSSTTLSSNASSTASLTATLDVDAAATAADVSHLVIADSAPAPAQVALPGPGAAPAAAEDESLRRYRDQLLLAAASGGANITTPQHIASGGAAFEDDSVRRWKDKLLQEAAQRAQQEHPVTSPPAGSATSVGDESDAGATPSSHQQQQQHNRTPSGSGLGLGLGGFLRRPTRITAPDAAAAAPASKDAAPESPSSSVSFADVAVSDRTALDAMPRRQAPRRPPRRLPANRKPRALSMATEYQEQLMQPEGAATSPRKTSPPASSTIAKPVSPKTAALTSALAMAATTTTLRHVPPARAPAKPVQQRAPVGPAAAGYQATPHPGSVGSRLTPSSSAGSLKSNASGSSGSGRSVRSNTLSPAASASSLSSASSGGSLSRMLVPAHAPTQPPRRGRHLRSVSSPTPVPASVAAAAADSADDKPRRRVVGRPRGETLGGTGEHRTAQQHTSHAQGKQPPSPRKPARRVPAAVTSPRKHSGVGPTDAPPVGLRRSGSRDGKSGGRRSPVKSGNVNANAAARTAVNTGPGTSTSEPSAHPTSAASMLRQRRATIGKSIQPLATPSLSKLPSLEHEGSPVSPGGKPTAAAAVAATIGNTAAEELKRRRALKAAQRAAQQQDVPKNSLRRADSDLARLAGSGPLRLNVD